MHQWRIINWLACWKRKYHITNMMIAEKERRPHQQSLYLETLGSARWNLFFHSALVRAISIHVLLGLPLILLTQKTIVLPLLLIDTHISISCTCPNHPTRFFLILSSTGRASNFLQIHSFFFIYLLVYYNSSISAFSFSITPFSLICCCLTIGIKALLILQLSFKISPSN